ncbi:hypothetical protein GPECTOR_34g804 [Gonium pectorale]|uniref:F-box domain-containing protein n=1 Tax=Gonium pectorale TaxID=33097 RepID=A0A150GDI3_GONPE|nr:hypothetical protein GPECTOR_34g804 [Gonium pectorale]|eukprot:KXZ47645.1 hypothetical protein GPECTOR_34g804 [Gonium pectorale]
MPAALGAWVMAANVISDTTHFVLPKELQALVDAVRGFRSRRRQAKRRHAVGLLAPLTLEREWLFGALPPAVTANVLGRLDPASRKALRAACRRTRLAVDAVTTRLTLDGRALRRLTSGVAPPLSLLFPALRELHLAGSQPTAGRRGGRGAGGTGGGAAVAGSPAQLVAALGAGAIEGLPSLELLDLSRWRRPACSFSKHEWKAMLDVLPDSEAEASGAAAPGSSAAALAGCHAGMHGGGGGGKGGRGAGALTLRLDWRLLPLRREWEPVWKQPDWKEVQWALRLAARARPQVHVELEGPPLPLPHPGTLAAFRGLTTLRRLPVAVAAVPVWARFRFEHLATMSGIRHLTMRLPAEEPAGAVLAALQELRYLELLSLPATTLRDSDLPAAAAAAAAAAPGGLLQELVQHQMAQLAAVAGGGAAAAGGGAAQPLHHMWAPAPAAAVAAGGPGGSQRPQAHGGAHVAPPAAPEFPVCLREVCVMFDERTRRQARPAGAGEAEADPVAAAEKSESAAAALLAAAAALPTLQRVRLWRCRSPGAVLKLLRPAVDRLQPRAGAVRSAVRGAHAAAHAGRGGPDAPPHHEVDEDQELGGELEGFPDAEVGGEGDGDADGAAETEALSDEEGDYVDEEGSESGSDDEGEEEEEEEEQQQQQQACGSGDGDGDSGDGSAALLTSLLTCRPWSSPSLSLAALLLGCCRNLVLAGGDAGLLYALAAAGRQAQPAAAWGAAAPSSAATRASGIQTATARLVVRRQGGLDERLLLRLLSGLPGLASLGLAGCGGVGLGEVLAVRGRAGAGAVSLAWSHEG